MVSLTSLGSIQVNFSTLRQMKRQETFPPRPTAGLYCNIFFIIWSHQVYYCLVTLIFATFNVKSLLAVVMG